MLLNSITYFPSGNFIHALLPIFSGPPTQQPAWRNPQVSLIKGKAQGAKNKNPIPFENRILDLFTE
jgi:hypothetical protein